LPEQSVETSPRPGCHGVVAISHCVAVIHGKDPLHDLRVNTGKVVTGKSAGKGIGGRLKLHDGRSTQSRSCGKDLTYRGEFVKQPDSSPQQQSYIGVHSRFPE
jgi:hypothetical protein